MAFIRKNLKHKIFQHTKMSFSKFLLRKEAVQYSNKKCIPDSDPIRLSQRL